MTYRLIIALPFNTILVFQWKFASEEAALDYRDATTFPALEPWSAEKIKAYRGFVIEFPFGEEHGSGTVTP